MTENTRFEVPPVEEVKPQGTYILEEIKSELTRLNGRIEDLERAQKEQMDGGSQGDIPQKLQQMEEHLQKLTESLDRIQSHPVLTNSDEIFRAAKAAYQEKKYEKAIAALDTYLSLKKISHQEEAIFLKAESYYQLKEYKKAILDYSKFPEKYRRSSKMPDALYKIGLSFESLGMKEDAKGFFQELVDKYPKSAEAKKARKKKL